MCRKPVAARVEGRCGLIERFPQAPKGGLAGFVERTLRSSLMEGRLRPGERLVTRDLARQLGTSPTPVREAMLKLVAAGALHALPAQAFQVPELTPDRYREISEVRRIVEGLAAEKAAARATPALLARLREASAAYRAARRAGDVAAALHHNRAFRFALYEAADSPTLLSIIESLWLRIGPSLNYLYPVPAKTAILRHNYDDLVEALARGDGAAVRAAVERAVQQGTELLLANMCPPRPAASGAAAALP